MRTLRCPRSCRLAAGLRRARGVRLARTAVAAVILMLASSLAPPLTPLLAAQSIPRAAAGQERNATLPAGDTLDLATALRYAAEHSPALARAEARVGMALGDVRSVGQWPNPSLEYRRENMGAPIPLDEFVTAYVPVDVTGRRIQLSRATARGRARIEAEGLSARRDVELQIASAWVHAVLSSAVGRTLRTHFEAVEEIARQNDARAREGAVADAVAFRTRIESARLAQELAVAEADALNERHLLAGLLGLLPDDLPPLPNSFVAEATARATTTGLVIDAGPIGVTPDGTIPDDAELLARAMRDRAEVRAAALAQEEAMLRRRFEQGSVLGDWQLQAGSKRTGGFMAGQIGLAVPLPLFNRNDGARQRAESVVRDADAASRAIELRVAGEVRAAAARLRSLMALRTPVAEAMPLGEIIARSASVAYLEGEMSLLELLDAQRAATDGQRSALQFFANLNLAHLSLARAVGAPLVSGSP